MKIAWLGLALVLILIGCGPERVYIADSGEALYESANIDRMHTTMALNAIKYTPAPPGHEGRHMKLMMRVTQVGLPDTRRWAVAASKEFFDEGERQGLIELFRRHPELFEKLYKLSAGLSAHVTRECHEEAVLSMENQPK